MKISITNRLYIGFAFAFILIVVIGFTSYKTFSSQAEQEDWIMHTYKVIDQIDDVELNVYEMRFAARSFLYTKDSAFFDEFKQEASNISTQLSLLQNLAIDNAPQLNRIMALKNRLDNFISYLQNTFITYQASTRQDIINITASMQPAVDSIQKQFVLLTDEENKLLTERNAKNEVLLKRAVNVLVLDIILIILMIGLLIYFILNEFNKRQRAEEAIRRNVERLEQTNNESHQKNWLLTGLTNVNVAGQGVNSVSEICESILSCLLQYLELPVGAFYSLIEGMNGLQLAASIGIQTNDATSINHTLGENALTTKKILVIKNVPSAYWSIESALGKIQPGEIVYIPLLQNEIVTGVIELGSFNSFTEQQLNFLEIAGNTISIALYSAQSARKIKNLLRQLGQQNDELMNQHEELLKTNEELERQAEVLQKSEEELKVQEEELRKINEELLARNEALELTRQTMVLKNEELENTSKYKSEFLANMSHELRTPLNSILILGKQLSENKTKNLTEKQIEYGKIIYKSGSDLLELINDMLDLAKIESGKIELHYQEVKTESIVNDMKELFNVVAKEKEVAFTTSIEHSVPEFISTDILRVEQIVKNLLSNAFKFTDKHGEVKLMLYVPSKGNSKMLHIEVTDTGIGIPVEKQQLIFEAFQQADGSTNRKYGGTGLGLSISKELIRLLNGEIHVQSKEGDGSTFTVHIPLVPGIIQAGAGEEKNIIQEPVYKSPPHQSIQDDRNSITENEKVILIIEDDVQFASLLRDFAREHNYKAVIALQGDEGLLFAKKYKPDAIILDIKLPVIDGWTILRLLKDDAALKHIPVHVITGAENNISASGNIISYLRKPVDKQDIENAFEMLMENTLTKFRKLLILAGEHLNDDSLKKFIEKKHFDVACTYVNSVGEMLSELNKNSFDAVIADIGKDLSQAKDELKKLKNEVDKYNLPVIVYIDADISSTDELELMKVSDVVIREAEMSKNRLMNEVELFFHKVDEGKEPKPVINITDEKMFNGKKVLLVDDDMRNVFVLSNILEDNKMKVIPAVNGKDALEELKKNPDTNIILMDIMMPEMDGYEAMRQIRNDPQFATLPVIALTAKAMKDDRQKCIEAGASDYITKPVDITKLLSLMRVWLSQ
jgi:signal transduction histidine kinase/DNA-binding response OmpR family regulator/CHASE3 domain sensor protein